MSGRARGRGRARAGEHQTPARRPGSSLSQQQQNQQQQHQQHQQQQQLQQGSFQSAWPSLGASRTRPVSGQPSQAWHTSTDSRSRSSPTTGGTAATEERPQQPPRQAGRIPSGRGRPLSEAGAAAVGICSSRGAAGDSSRSDVAGDSNNSGATGDRNAASMNGQQNATVATNGMANLMLSEAPGGGAVAKRGFQRREPLVTRPESVDKRGTGGQTVSLLTNYVRIEETGETCIYQYHVDFKPAIDSQRLRCGLLSTHRNRLGEVYIFDGMQLFTQIRLQDQVTILTSKIEHDGTIVEVSVTRVAELPPHSPVFQQINSRNFNEALASIGMVRINQSYFDPTLGTELPHLRLEVMPGMSSAISYYDAGLMLNMDASFKIIRLDTALDVINHCHRQFRGRYRNKACEELLGTSVLTRYNNCKTYKIDDIDWNTNPTHTFKKRGEEISYVQYYRQMYNIIITDVIQPMLVSRPKKKQDGGPDLIYLIPEICHLTGRPKELEKNYPAIKEIEAITRPAPTQRVEAIHQVLSRVRATPESQQKLTRWGIRLAPQLAEVTGRTLPIETILAGNGPFQVHEQTNDWGLRNKTMYKSTVLNAWLLVYPNSIETAIQPFLNKLQLVSRGLGFALPAPRRIPMPSDSASTYVEKLRCVMSPEIQMVVCVIPESDDRYKAIKKLLCCQIPVPSQCIKYKNVRKADASVATKVAVQLNAKLDGEPWICNPVLALANIMVAGYDTYHDPKRSNPSVGALVCSLNDNFSKWYSQPTKQSPGEELVSKLDIMITDSVKKYHSFNGKLPDKIVIYRDGVGDGQLPVVYNYELPQIKAALQTLCKDKTVPEIIFIVVKKRINTKFFVRNRGGYSNPAPRTVVDSDVTRKESVDFFLVSQSVRQGTATPTHYNILENQTSWLASRIQKFSYRLTHLYYNWPGTIRVPAPCQYAHKLAYLVGETLHAEPDLSLADKLYYL